MDFFDDVMTKAKEAIDVASKKTNDAVTVQKQKFDIASLESKRARDFQILGELYYNKIKNGAEADGDIGRIVKAINEKNEKINSLKSEINSIKRKRICPKCGTAVEQTSIYCGACGAKLVFEEEDGGEQ